LTGAPPGRIVLHNYLKHFTLPGRSGNRDVRIGQTRKPYVTRGG